MWEDPIVSEVRHVREELSARFEFDVSAVFGDIRERQAALGPRLVRRKKVPRPELPSVPDRDSAGLHPGR